VILALELLERSGSGEMEQQLLPLLQSPSAVVQKYVLSRVMALKLYGALPLIEQVLRENQSACCHPDFTTAFYFLTAHTTEVPASDPLPLRKAALIGLSFRPEEEARVLLERHLVELAHSPGEEERLAVLDILSQAPRPDFVPYLVLLLEDASLNVCHKAMETAGKAKVESLLPLLVEVGTKRKAFSALQIALAHLGDSIFHMEHFPDAHNSRELMMPLIKAAGKVKGEVSTQFLLHLLKTEVPFQDAVIDALWTKNADLHAKDKRSVNEWMKAKLVQSRKKALYCHSLTRQAVLPLLATALDSEVKQDIRIVIKGLALMHDRAQVNRVRELLAIGSAEKVANAIEMLEQMIPKRCFLLLESLLDFHLDKQKRIHFIGEKKRMDVKQIIRDILSENPARCSAWVKSVACYSLLERTAPELTDVLAAEPDPTDQAIFLETRDYVLAQVHRFELLKYAADRESADVDLV
jgi:HEAT repeat protein